MINTLRNLARSKAGASAAEYALMIAFIGGVIVVAAAGLGTNVKQVFTDFAPKMQTPA